jgi:8-oxo-dGTP pyrophosphatase MutT (NUDIX family)
VARLRSALATSAGGIVVSPERDRPSLVVGMRRRSRDTVTWTLPKGTPDPGESVEETALREVAEETGLEVRIVERLPSIEYAFVQDGTRIQKTVHYFLMEPTGGDLSRHDAEFERVRWVPFDEARGLLSFATERELVAVAADRLAGLEAAGASS